MNAEIDNLSLHILEAHKLSQECGLRQIAPATHFQPGFLQHLCSNSGSKLLPSESPPSKKWSANKQIWHLYNLHFAVYKISKIGFGCSLCAFFFFSLSCFVLQNCSPSIYLNHFTDHRGQAAKDCDYLSKPLLWKKLTKVIQQIFWQIHLKIVRLPQLTRWIMWNDMRWIIYYKIWEKNTI